MKTFFSPLLIFTTFFGLAGCGSKSVGKLEVSQSFATTNTSFGGGLVISGVHLSTGNTFSQSILSGKEMKMKLKQGTWKISAVGWDGGGSSGNEQLFAGKPFCGTVLANLETSSTVVDLSINETNCNTSDFTAGHTYTGGELRNFGAVITCNTFFNPAINLNNSISSQIISAGTGSDGFCESTNLDSDLKSEIEAVKIYTINKLPGQPSPSLGFNSGCMQGVAGSESKIYPASTLKLPFNNLPLTVVTFKDTSCSKPVATFHFKDGLAAGSPRFDHLLQIRGSTDMKLVLPANSLKRAKSALIGLLPSIKKYNSAAPLRYATTPSNFQTLTLPGIINTIHSVIVDESDCGTVTSSGQITTPTCVDMGQRVELTYKGLQQAGTASITLTNGTRVKTYNFDVITDDGIFNSLEYNSQARVLELLGQDVNVYSNFFNQNDYEKHFGVLSDIRKMFSPDGAGGVLGITNSSKTFVEACNDLLMDKTETIYNAERMAFESFRVLINDGVTEAPRNYMCVTNTLSTDCSTNNSAIPFDKRMKIYDHKVSLSEPVFVMEFSCSSLIGRFESKLVEVQGLRRHINKQIVSWNTNPESTLSYQRMELLKIKVRDSYIDGSWKKMSERRNMSRIEKIDADNFSVWSYNFNTFFNSSTYMQKAQTIFLQTDTTGNRLAYRHDPSDGSSSSDPYSILTSTTLPPNNSIADKFNLSEAYPQTRESTGTVTMSPLPSGNNADKIDDTLDFNQAALGSADFTNAFGSSFYSAR